MSADKNPGRRILLVEDNPGDVRLIREALKEANLAHEVTVAWDGAEALDYLYRRGKHCAAQQPELIMLDLNLPKKSGHEVLVEIKSDPKLGHIPVIVFTSSSAPQDVSAAYAHHANCYVTKPSDLGELLHVIALIESFWLGAAKLPSKRAF